MYQGIDFEDTQWPTTADVNSRQDWLDNKFHMGLDFPNLPYFIDTDGFKMTESIAIHQYIADKWMPDLLGTSIEERARVQMIVGVLGDVKKGVTMPMYMNENRDEVKANALTCVNAFMERVGSVKSYLAGENLTYIDFYWYELLQAADWITDGEVM